MTNLNFFSFTMKIIIFLLTIFIGLSHCKQDNPFFTSLKAICDNTLHPNTCYDSLFPLIDSNQNTYDPHFLYNISIQVAINEISRVHSNFTKILENIDKNTYLSSALESCRDFMSLALYNLNRSLPISGRDLTIRETRTNFRVWISGAGADLQTCKDDFKYTPNEVFDLVVSKLDKATKLVTISLAIISKIDQLMISSPENRLDDHFQSDWEPDWLSFEEWKILDTSNEAMTPDAVVAADGSGNYKTITEAIKAVPLSSDKRFVIYVKKGVYKENVKVDRRTLNVLMYGDGMSETIVTGNRSNKTGSRTSFSSTFAAYGDGFIAKDIGFQNTAGPQNGQAVALFSGSDRSVFYRCQFEGYQDTLFTQKHRQFYRDCKIYGTVDFIFGEAAVVIQNSDILVRKPLGPAAVITGQGKWDPNSVSGISIQNCSIDAAEDLGDVKAFLGRPWKDYSTVVVMQSKLGSLIDPKGWAPWRDGVTLPDTVLYAEYKNVGPGSETSSRASWKGLFIDDAQTVSNFTVTSFIGGDQWIPATGVPFQAGL
ncbi:hypothetical protein CASFOL_020376 [Castilleja foliolosa]|uniref:Pectinesterase n=1 Tax=Castilleja foliolosa TaxID=1961234 RepID=A0ABD3D3J2_9LAMI